MTITTASVIRLALLGLIGGLFQLSVVSQVTIFGVPADLTPLMVASVGFIAGSMTGAVFGFCLGLFIDVSLYQTLGVSSLVFTAVGYGAGRIRELRDPAHGLAPVAVGAAATAIAAIGFTLLQFLLGVQAPVSLLLLREILLTVVLNTLIALPVYAIMRRALLPFLPEDPRRRRRRAYTTGGLSPISRALVPQTRRRTRPPDHAPAGVARRRARRHRVRAVRDRLLPALVPAGADGPGGGHAGARQPRAQGAHRGAARRHRRPQQRQARAHQGRRGRPDGPEPAARERARGRRRVPQEPRRRRERPPARRRTATTRSGASSRTTGARTPRPRSASAARCASRPRTARPVAGPDRAPGRDRPDRALQAHGPGAADLAQDDPQARDPRDRRRAVLQRHDPHRRRRARSSTTCASTPSTSRASSSRSATCASYPKERARRAAVRARVRDRPGAAQGGRVRGRRPGHADRPERAREALRQVPARHRRLPARRRRRARAPRRPAHRLGAASPSRASG